MQIYANAHMHIAIVRKAALHRIVAIWRRELEASLFKEEPRSSAWIESTVLNERKPAEANDSSSSESMKRKQSREATLARTL